MSWERRGRIFCPDSERDWMATHAANPLAVRLEGDRYRIFFNSRDAQNRSSVGYVEVDITRPQEILTLSDEPVLGPGTIGAFDDSGVSLGWLVHNGAPWRLYYVGWNLGVTVPFRNSIGLALSDDGLTFRRHSLAPVLDRNPVDPFSLSYPCVIEGYMWYGSHTRTGPTEADMEHVIRLARSKDGIHWTPSTDICVGPASASETAFARPSVLHEGGLWHMWFSYRGDRYRIGHATSRDGAHWVRDAIPALEPADSGWDSDSVEYPYVFRHDEQLCMLYCGNSYGRSGFGLAVWS